MTSQSVSLANAVETKGPATYDTSHISHCQFTSFLELKCDTNGMLFTCPGFMVRISVVIFDSFPNVILICTN